MNTGIKFKEEEINKIIDLYINQYKTLTEIRNVFKNKIKADSVIKRVLIENGVKLRSRTNSRIGSHALDVDYFKVIDTEEKAYWLGYLAADGCIYKNGTKTSLTSKDLDIINKFKKAINSEHKISNGEYFDKRTDKIYKRYTIQICSKNFTEHIQNAGVTYQKSDKLEFPKISEDLYRHFVRGLFDGDGSIYSRIINKPIRINLISTLELINFLQEYLLTNFNIEIKKIRKVTENKSNVYKMFLYADSDKFLDWLYSNSMIYLDRKYNLYMEYKNYINEFGKPDGKRKVLQLDLSNNPIKIWNSITEAKNSCNANHISQVCQGELKSTGGFKWKYVNHNETITI